MRNETTFNGACIAFIFDIHCCSDIILNHIEIFEGHSCIIDLSAVSGLSCLCVDQSEHDVFGIFQSLSNVRSS